MHFVDVGRGKAERREEERQPAPVHPGFAALRRAMRQHTVTFPSQVPLFLREPAGDMQWRMVMLYFVRGWNSPDVATRFNVPVHRIRKILNAWSVRALELGYIQVIDPEAFAVCCREEAHSATSQDVEEAPAPTEVTAATPPFRTRADGLQHVGAQGPDLIAALDTAVANCERLQGEFWDRTATLLRDMRTAAAIAFAMRLSNERASGLITSFLGGLDVPQALPNQGLPTRDKERAAHVV